MEAQIQGGFAAVGGDEQHVVQTWVDAARAQGLGSLDQRLDNFPEFR